MSVSVLDKDDTFFGCEREGRATQTELMNVEYVAEDLAAKRGRDRCSVSFNPRISVTSFERGHNTEPYTDQEAYYDSSQDNNYYYDYKELASRRRIVPKRPKLNFTQNGAKGTTSYSSSTATLPLKKTDPCSVVPLGIWHHILSCMRPSQMTKASLISKTWLGGVRSHPIWRMICENGKLGTPKRKYHTYLALACSNSYWACEVCLSHSHGRPLMSNIPLEIPIDEYGGEPWLLCLNCRNQYYETHAELLYVHNGNEIYRPDIEELDSEQMDVWKAHGGFVGAFAHTRKTAIVRRFLCMARSKDAWESPSTNLAKKKKYEARSCDLRCSFEI
ncbi:hypothetical protein BGZ47_005945 [Haplosporangium gracile]|nr:hypothetical protein BGZ47_005945 [Haplosporangium gracile]